MILSKHSTTILHEEKPPQYHQVSYTVHVYLGNPINHDFPDEFHSVPYVR